MIRVGVISNRQRILMLQLCTAQRSVKLRLMPRITCCALRSIYQLLLSNGRNQC